MRRPWLASKADTTGCPFRHAIVFRREGASQGRTDAESAEVGTRHQLPSHCLGLSARHKATWVGNRQNMPENTWLRSLKSRNMGCEIVLPPQLLP